MPKALVRTREAETLAAETKITRGPRRITSFPAGQWRSTVSRATIDCTPRNCDLVRYYMKDDTVKGELGQCLGEVVFEYLKDG